jgi:hypothetical protein
MTANDPSPLWRVRAWQAAPGNDGLNHCALDNENGDDDEYESGGMLPNFVFVLVLLLVFDIRIFKIGTTAVESFWF